MYNAIVVEEDNNKIECIIDLVENTGCGISIIGSCTSGREAIELVKKIMPDIIIIAIKVRGVNGLEAIKKIRTFNSSAHIIVVSEYNYFEFLKEAIRHGVDDYILKPVIKRDLKIALERIITKIKKEKEEISKINWERHRFEETLEYVENNLVYSVLFGDISNKRIKHLKEIMELNDYAYAFNMEFGENLSKNEAEVEAELPKIYEYIREKSGSEYKCVIGPKINRNIVVFVSLKESTDISKDMELDKIKSFAKMINEKVKLEMKCEIRIGIGNKEKIENMYNSYQNSLKCLRYEENQEIIYINDVSRKQHAKIKKYYDLQKKLMEEIAYGKEEVLNTFVLLFDKIDKMNEQEKRNKIIELFVLCHNAISSYSRNGVPLIEYSEKLSEIQSIKEQDLREWSYKKFQCIVRVMNTKRDGQVSPIIENSMRYIKEHYREELSLEEVAGNAGVTPQYFSKLFKEETGVRFIKWILGLRIDKAKELMNTGTMQIKEIGYMVGYNDPNYFSRIFKKVEGVSPTQYVKQVKNI